MALGARTVLAQEGRVDEAVVLADEAVELLATSDGLGKQADALLVLGGVLGRAGAGTPPNGRSRRQSRSTT